MLSSDSSSSSSPEPEVVKVTKKSKDKGKKKSVSVVAGHSKNEGVDPHWDYKPPSGATLLQNAEDAGEFDWDAVANDDDLELWLIRVPESVKPKYLENTTIEVPPVAKSSRTGTLNRKHATFDIWSVGEDDEQDIGGEEIKALSCLLPRKSKKGKLYPGAFVGKFVRTAIDVRPPAPKPIARHIVLSAQPVMPTPDPSSTGLIEPYTRPPRENYPTEVLTHRFMPYGSLSSTNEAEAANLQMDVDAPAVQPDAPSPTQKKLKPSKADSPKVVPYGSLSSTNEAEAANLQMDVDVDAPAVQPDAPSPTQKKLQPSKADSPKVDTKKTKGKKRKGDGGEAPPGKKPKKAKMS